LGEFEGEIFCPLDSRAEGVAGVGATPLSCSVKRGKAKHFLNPFRRKFCERSTKRKREKCFALRCRQAGGAAGRGLRPSGRRLSLKKGSRIFKQRAQKHG